MTVLRFFWYRVDWDFEKRIRDCLRAAYASEGAISYSEVKDLTVYEFSVINDELYKLQERAKREAKRNN